MEVHMKKLLGICVITMVVVSLLGPSPVGAAESGKHVITVTGHAEMSVTPDQALATFGVITINDDVEKAKQDNDRIMQTIFDRMLITGIERSKIKTSMFSVQPLYRSDKTSGIETITGYQIQNTISVTVDDVRKVSQVIDAAFAAGANQFQGIRFGLKKEQSLQDELLKQALLDGKRKAALIAETVGGKLGRPVSITENGQISPLIMDTVRFNKAALSSTTPVAAGSMTATADVQMIFEIE
jgi:uncharacterized protein YggE